jgi:hypothetical protein
MAAPLTPAAEYRTLEAAAPPTTAAAALRLRITPGNGAAVPLPTGNAADILRYSVLLLNNPLFSATAAFFGPNG